MKFFRNLWLAYVIVYSVVGAMTVIFIKKEMALIQNGYADLAIVQLVGVLAIVGVPYFFGWLARRL